jgi:hypothetical protein
LNLDGFAEFQICPASSVEQSYFLVRPRTNP